MCCFLPSILKRPKAKNILMAVFVVLWPYLLTTKLSYLQKNNFGHTITPRAANVRNRGTRTSISFETHTFTTIIICKHAKRGIIIFSYLWSIFVSNCPIYHPCTPKLVRSWLLKCGGNIFRVHTSKFSPLFAGNLFYWLILISSF